MRRLGVGMVVVLGAAMFSGGAAYASRQPAGPAPASVTCFASATGAVGATGAAGETGAKGPVGDSFPVPNGPARSVHVRGKLPDCSSIAGICLEGVNQGLSGSTGATGPAGPKGDTGWIPGKARLTHVRQLAPCEGFPVSCRYGLRGPDGATGATGPEGAKGDRGADARGPRRDAHVHPAGEVFQPSNASVTLAGCDLPETGGSATPALPYALLLVALGGLVVLVADRRRSVLRR